MKILLIKDKELLEFKLPDRVEGNVWLSEIDDKGIERNIINVEASPDGKWRLISNSDYYIADAGKRVPFSFLSESTIEKIFLLSLLFPESLNRKENKIQKLQSFFLV